MTLRPVTEADADLLLAWRNDPLTRRMSIGRRAVSKAAHAHWFAARQPSLWIGQEMFFVGVSGNILPRDVGVFRGDPVQFGDGAFEVSVTIAPEERGHGYAVKLIRLGTDRLCSDYLLQPIHAPAVVCLCHATIRLENAASIRAFLRAGYQWDCAERNRKFVHLKWVREKE